MQWEIARLLAARTGNIFIVGDVGQAIYSFRGCSPEATVGQFGAAYPNGTIIRLPANYRSSATIVRVANELIGRSGIDAKYRLEMAAIHAGRRRRCPSMSMNTPRRRRSLWPRR